MTGSPYVYSNRTPYADGQARVYEHGLLWTEMKTTCPKCSCDFIYRPKNVQEHVEYNFDTKTGKAYRYINCPECGEECIYTDPTVSRTYNDSLDGTPTGEDTTDDIIYDGGDEDLKPGTDDGPVYDEDGNEEL